MRCNAPAPKRAGRSRARPQNMPRCGLVTKAPDRRIVSPCFPFLPASRHHAAVPQYQPLHAVLRQAGARIERERGASIAPDPPGLITLECWPGERGLRSFVAVAARRKQEFGGTRGPRKRRACASRRSGLSMRSLPRGLEIDQEREVFSLAAKKKLRKP